MRPARTRRDALRLCGSALGGSLAGCVGVLQREPRPSPTITPAPVPTTSPSPTPTSTPLPDQIPTTAVGFTVAVRRQATEAHPARIAVGFSNETAGTLTLSAGTTPPFATYWSEPRDDGSRAALVPDMAESPYDRSPIAWRGVPAGEEPVPTPPVDGCWRLEHAGVDELLLRETAVESGETLRQPFDVFAYRLGDQGGGCLAPGEYAFVDAGLNLWRGGPADIADSPRTPVTFRFVLAVGPDGSVRLARWALETG